jgi:hypothetical protein
MAAVPSSLCQYVERVNTLNTYGHYLEYTYFDSFRSSLIIVADHVIVFIEYDAWDRYLS